MQPYNFFRMNSLRPWQTRRCESFPTLPCKCTRRIRQDWTRWSPDHTARQKHRNSSSLTLTTFPSTTKMPFSTVGRRWLLLKRRTSPILTICDWHIGIPDETFTEKLIAILFRGKIHYIDIETPKGTMKHVRVNPSVLKDPIDRNLPLSANELANYMRHAP